jgi:hypothetical protein
MRLWKWIQCMVLLKPQDSILSVPLTVGSDLTVSMRPGDRILWSHFIKYDHWSNPYVWKVRKRESKTWSTPLAKISKCILTHFWQMIWLKFQRRQRRRPSPSSPRRSAYSARIYLKTAQSMSGLWLSSIFWGVQYLLLSEKCKLSPVKKKKLMGNVFELYELTLVRCIDLYNLQESVIMCLQYN